MSGSDLTGRAVCAAMSAALVSLPRRAYLYVVRSDEDAALVSLWDGTRQKGAWWDREGRRVAVLVSPWVPGGYVLASMREDGLSGGPVVPGSCFVFSVEAVRAEVVASVMES